MTPAKNTPAFVGVFFFICFSIKQKRSALEPICERLVFGDKFPELFPENAPQGSVAQV